MEKRSSSFQQKSAGKAGDREPKAPESSDAFFWDRLSDSQLFVTQDRATLTFYGKGGVTSIHYDKNRDEIFYKGHNVKNMNLTAEQWLELQQFPQYLQKHHTREALWRSYEACLKKLRG